MHNAEPVTRASAPELYDMVGRLAQRAGLPTPRVYLIRSDQPNAFATGRSPQNAAVAATTGILQVLDRDELEGVIAHELAHVKNRDTLTMTIAATVAGAISMLAQFGFFFGGGREPRQPDGAARRAPGGAARAAGGAADPDDDQPDPGIFRRPRRRGDQRQPAGAGAARCARSRPMPAGSSCRAPSATRPRRRSSSSTRSRARGWTTCSRPIRTSRTASGRWRRWPARCGRRPRSGRARSPPSGAAAEPCARAWPPGRRRRRSWPGCWSAAGASPTRPAPAGRWRRWRPAERARAQALAAGTLRHLGRIDAVLAQLSAATAAAGGAERAAAGDGRALPRRGAARMRRWTARCGWPGRAQGAPAVRAGQRRGAAGRRGGAGALGGGAGGGAAGLAGRAGRGGLGRGGRGGDRRGAPAGGAARPDAEASRPRRRPGRRRSGPSGCRPAACGCPGGRRSPALPGYAEGAWWVQDAAAALPVRLLGRAGGAAGARPLRRAGRQDAAARGRRARR